MAFDFPSPATEDLQFTPSGGPVYVFKSGVWKVKPSDNLTVPGNLIVTGTTTLTGTAALGTATFSGNLTPTVTGTINLGSATYRWATVYTS